MSSLAAQLGIKLAGQVTYAFGEEAGEALVAEVAASPASFAEDKRPLVCAISAAIVAGPPPPAVAAPPLPKPLPSATRFAGKFALVTGSSKGIGAGIAIRLAREGAHVAIHYGRDEAGARSTQAAIVALGIDVSKTMILGANMSEESEIRAMFATYFSTWPTLDVLIPNAGVQYPNASHEKPVAEFDKVIAINLRGYVICAQIALAHFVERDAAGTIVFCSSVHQIVPKPTYLGYACSKAAIGHMTRTLALEYAGRGIRVNAVAPGAVATPMNMAWIDDPVKRAGVCDHIPQGRPGSAEEIAATFAFMASDDASYITGQTLFACGGLSLYPEFRDAWSSE
jgi:glucose 1-dehydrogenase